LASRAPALELVRDAWAERRLGRWLGTRLLVKSYAGTKLGRVWLVLRPAVELFSLAFLLGGVLKTPSSGVPYLLFLVIGLQAWRLFDRTVFWGTRSFDRFGRFARRFDFPLLLVPISATVPALLEFAIYSVFVVGAAIFYAASDGTLYIDIGPELLVTLAGYLLIMALGLGLTFWLSVLNAKARDVRFSVIYVLQIWLYLTPVVYPVTSLGKWSFLATINPVAAPVTMVRQGLIGTAGPDPLEVVLSVAVAVALVVSGLWFFNRSAPALATVGRVVADEEEEEDTP
jgi:lipopolysaccharide transport system permease protein